MLLLTLTVWKIIEKPEKLIKKFSIISFTSIGNDDEQVILQPFVISRTPVDKATIICLTGFAVAMLEFVSMDTIDIMYSDNIEKITITPATVSMLITDLDIALLKASLKDIVLMRLSFFAFFILTKSFFINFDSTIAPM